MTRRRSRAPTLVMLLSAAAASAAQPQLVAPAERVAGKSQEEWSAAWWQWAGSFARHESPIADQTGELCASKQAGDVWFLAGTYGTQRTERACRVPRGKHLFFPLINRVVMPRKDNLSCAGMQTTVARMTDGASHLVLEIDGKRHYDLARHRQATRECFDMGARTTMRIYPSASNGYYVMLRPLPRGTHVLNFGGVLPGMAQAVTYTLVIE